MLLALGLIAGEALADTKKLVVDKNSAEGQYLELVSLESNSAKKIALLEQFLVLFPASKPELAVWVYKELQDRYRRAGDLDKALATGEKLLAIEPDDIETARANWRIAETKKDEALVKKWSDATAAIADRIVKLPLPSDPEESKAAEERQAYARQFVVNTDHDEFAAALARKDPSERIAALEEYAKKNPQNPNGDQIEIAEFLAYKETGDVQKTMAAAEKIVSHNESYENALLFIAEINFRRNREPKRTAALAAKFIERAAVASKPDGVTDQEWTRTKSQNLALAHFIIGSLHVQVNEWASADVALRAALPLIGDDQFRATVLNQLGFANYRMQRALEAIKFYTLCAAIQSPFKEQAAKAVVSIKAEFNLP